jgi:hypothetical protein
MLHANRPGTAYVVRASAGWLGSTCEVWWCGWRGDGLYGVFGVCRV